MVSRKPLERGRVPSIILDRKIHKHSEIVIKVPNKTGELSAITFSRCSVCRFLHLDCENVTGIVTTVVDDDVRIDEGISLSLAFFEVRKSFGVYSVAIVLNIDMMSREDTLEVHRKAAAESAFRKVVL